MTGLLGTRAGLNADLNLLFQVVIFLLLLTGYAFAKRRKLRTHGRIMEVVAGLNWVSVLLVMGRSLIENLTLLLTYYPTLGGVTLSHALIGGSATILGTTWAFKKFRNTRMWMRVTMILWVIAFLLGVAVYIQGYILQP